MTETTTLAWSEVLDRVEAALAQALRDTEARARRLEDLADVPQESAARRQLRDLEERLQARQFPAAQAEQADAALAAVAEEVRQWQAKAGGPGQS